MLNKDFHQAKFVSRIIMALNANSVKKTAYLDKGPGYMFLLVDLDKVVRNVLL